MNNELKDFSVELYHDLTRQYSGWFHTPRHDSMFMLDPHNGARIKGIALLAYYDEGEKRTVSAKKIPYSDVFESVYQYHARGIQAHINEYVMCSFMSAAYQTKP